MNPHQQVIERLRSIDRSDNFSAQNKLPSSREEIASIVLPIIIMLVRCNDPALVFRRDGSIASVAKGKRKHVFLPDALR